MARKRSDMRTDILKTCKDIVRREGIQRLTFDAVAARLGVTKQAVIYWFPTKEDLVAGFAIPALRDEAKAAIKAVRGAVSTKMAVHDFVHAVARFHLRDLDRFRLMYVSVQATGKLAPLAVPDQLAEAIHEITGDMYGELADCLAAGGVSDPRQKAVAVHLAVLGLVLMVSLTDAINDPLAHEPSVLAATLAEMLAAVVKGAST